MNVLKGIVNRVKKRNAATDLMLSGIDWRAGNG